MEGQRGRAGAGVPGLRELGGRMPTLHPVAWGQLAR